MAKKKSKAEGAGKVIAYRYRPLGERADERQRHQDHAYWFLVSSEFPPAAIKPVLPRGEKGGSKKDIAIAAAEMCLDDHEVARQLALNYAREPKTWLAVYQGSATAFTKAADPADLVLAHRFEDTWHGPIEDPDDDRHFYICTRSIPQAYLDDEGNPQKQYLRWICVAEVAVDHLALHWSNFNYSENPSSIDERGRGQYPYWRLIPKLVSDLEDLTSTKWSKPNLSWLVLYPMLEAYEPRRDLYSWAHQRIRAESRGVALTASGRKGARRAADDSVEINVAGITELTDKLAADVAAELRITDPAIVEQLERRILFTIIRGFNPKSYQIELRKLAAPSPKEERLFRGHVYFGTGKKRLDPKSETRTETVDSVQHVKCFAEFGGSIGARDFLLAELERTPDK